MSVSQIYNDWNGPMLDATRSKFQSLIFARDGATLKSQAPANAVNFKLVLKAAQAVMLAKEYTSFRDQMERAYKNRRNRKNLFHHSSDNSPLTQIPGTAGVTPTGTRL